MLRKGQSVALLLVAGLLAAACASSDTEPNTAPAADETSVTSETPAIADESSGASVRRELGLTVRPESDVASNPFPSLEVDDVGQDRTVNVRNIFPAERPVLLWMWAPY